MDYDKLIERLHKEAYGSDIEDLLLGSATGISTLQAENVKLQYEVERQRRSADDMRHLCENAERAYTKAQADLARVTAERDAAVKAIERIRSCKDCGHYTGEWTPPCKECQDNEEYHPYFKWRGPQKED